MSKTDDQAAAATIPAEHTVGLIGIGLVGTALAERWLASGRKVVGYDIVADQRRRLTDLRGVAVENARTVFESAETIFISLPTSAITIAVLDEVRFDYGDDSFLRGKTIIDTTTGSPTEMETIGHRVMAQNGRYLDATIAGSSEQVRRGEAVVMVGGDRATVDECREVLSTFAARVLPVGPVGAGARMKLVVNLVLGLNRAVLAEGLCFAERTGVDPHLALEALRAGPAYSKAMDTKGHKMLTGDFTPQARLAQHAKDVGLILAAGETHGATLPFSTLHDQLLKSLIKAGWGDADNSAIIKAFQVDRAETDR